MNTIHYISVSGKYYTTPPHVVYVNIISRLIERNLCNAVQSEPRLASKMNRIDLLKAAHKRMKDRKKG